jgi:methylphosphotriester-DNA--protein-cysteine methyltransferase
MVGQLDALIQTGPSSPPVYSIDLARSLGTSVRTFQEATWSVLGMRLHDYIRQKKLLAVRRSLWRGALASRPSRLKMASGISATLRAPIGHCSANCHRKHERAPRAEMPRIYPKNTLPRATAVAHRENVVAS